MIDAGMEFAGNHVLKNINCTLEHNSRIGLIGSNGSGKSTLIKIMLGLLNPTSGKVLRAKKCQIAYLAQNLTLEPSLPMIEHIQSARVDIYGLKKLIDSLSQALHIDHNAISEAELHSAVEKFQALGGDEHENEVQFVCNSLGFTEADYPKPIALFSGGEQTRICLAAILLMPYDLLILDEPTNHLDIAMIGWLEKYLAKSNRPFMVVSHDRTFLDNTVNTIYHLQDAGLMVTKGNYSSFSEAYAIARMAQERQFDRQQKFIAVTNDFISRNIAGQKTNMAKSRLKMLSRMEIVQKPRHQKQIHLNINSSGRSGNDVYTLQDVEFGIPDGSSLARDINLKAHYQNRICIIGPNGCGKTTLLKILMGEHDIVSGHLKIGASLSLGYYDQHQIALDESLTVMDTLWQIVPEATRGYVLSWLARFGFSGDDVDKHVGILSGGEKSRLYLCVLIHQNPNLLIMDEPTNHLDMAMSDSLLKALQEFKGTIIFVSHDRYFISKLATKFWVFHKALDGNKLYPTVSEPDLEMQPAIELAFSIPEIKKAPPPPKEKKKKINPWLLQQLQNEIDAHHSEIDSLHRELDEINRQLADSQTYSDTDKALCLQQEATRILQDIDKTKLRIAELETDFLQKSYEA